ncbi:mixed lineage kinase domain-like protein [Denticeps clupeoides]|uniref:Protein kinase domain-containing protein n=1 Tax=Denticeps clupeoides TaxID=299321 RepID=A0AAY4D3Q8_9TELE|nr:mixed lineage kinase domain-like protein [Denticeps clupeoides]XP_028814479.1 mixed lineage kinase domain-like protein [Denticeps clupeoides]
MDLVEPILVIAEKLYSLCQEAKANKKRCARLAQRIRSLAELVKTAKVQSLGDKRKLVEDVLKELMLTLESAEEVLKKYSSEKVLVRMAKSQSYGEEFGSLNERLSEHAQLLSLALQVEQRKRLEEVFEETRRRSEDDKDRDGDRQELQKLLQAMQGMDAVYEVVDNTQNDVRQMKIMLENLRRPSIHLEAIREIPMEELSFDPTKPFMRSSISEFFEGEYNKFAVAIKRYACPISTSPCAVRTTFQKEVETMKRFESPNILRMFGICVQDGPSPNFLIVMEFCEKGSLRQVLDSDCKLPWSRKARMCLDAAQGIYRLHQSEPKFKFHGCIRSSKFLVAVGYTVKLGGFELAKTETSLRKKKEGKQSASCYCSPQQLKKIDHYDKACEIYSLGIVLWEIATRQVPFKDCTTSDIHKKVCKEKAMEPLPEDSPPQLKDLIVACRAYEPFHRPTAGVLVDKLRMVVEKGEED